MLELKAVDKRYLRSLGIMSGLCLALLLVRIIISGASGYWFIAENLALAWISLAIGLLLLGQLQRKSWLSWQNLVLSFLWLSFLPNTWYVLTDFIHLNPVSETNQIYDIVLISTLAFTGLGIGFYSLYLVHKELLKRLSTYKSALCVAIVILLSSFAIYLGRDLRWTTWNVVTNPSGIIINVSDRILHPFAHPTSFTVTGIFFVLISVMYYAIWQAIRPIKSGSR